MNDNKLIAEFMGLSIKEGVCYYTDVDDMFPMGIEVEEPYLPYDKSWDWLMPVIEQIDHLQRERIQSIEDALSTRCLGDVYNAVVEFIKEWPHPPYTDVEGNTYI